MKSFRKLQFAFVATLFASTLSYAQQDWIRTGTGLGVEKVRLAAADFKASSPDLRNAALLKAFNDTLWNDLDNAGIFDMVSKSFNPLSSPGLPGEVKFTDWNSPPPSASMLAFGSLGVTAESMIVQGWLDDVKNPLAAQVLAKQYQDQPTTDNARTIAHKFADEIIFRLGGGIPGIAESKIVFISARSGHKEVWMMDYDGANQHAITKLGSISLSPRISPDSSRIAFSSVTSAAGWQLQMFSLELGRAVSFPRFSGTTVSPAWAPDGNHIAFSSSQSGDPEIYVADSSGRNLKRVTTSPGPDVSPSWNPKTGAQIAFVSGRSGLPQVFTMEADGTNPQRMTDQGYAVSPAWSPNGQFLAFSWMRKYGPGAPGAQDIYIMDIVSKQWVQLTHDGGRNDFPAWSPDGRHLVFQSTRAGSEQLWTMLSDGSNPKQLTTSGGNTQPNWSSK
jgi:TolB protein